MTAGAVNVKYFCPFRTLNLCLLPLSYIRLFFYMRVEVNVIYNECESIKIVVVYLEILEGPYFVTLNFCNLR